MRLFHGAHMGNPTPYVVILRLLERTDWFIQDRASRLLCRLVSSRPDRGRPLGVAGTASPAETASAGAAPAAPSTPPPPGSAGAACLSFLDWAVRTLRSPGDPRCVAPATAALACLMCERELRPVAFRHGALGLLAPTLRSAAAGPHNVQLLYDAGLAVWLLTFYAPAAEGTVASGALAGLIETARGASKEKVVRVALQALRNLLDCQEAPGARASVQAASGRLAATLRLRAFHDDDLNAALDFLEGAGAGGGGAANHAGSWERYRQEVLSGALDWGGPRGDESFWRDHVPLLEEGNHALVKQLCTVLQAPSTPPRALAVACHDLGHIATAVPRGRAVIAETGAKATLLTNCTRAELEHALVDFRDSTGTCEGRGMRVTAAPASSTKVLGIFFFAGHGLQVSGRNYLVPSDFQVPNKHAKLDVMLRDTAKACVALTDVEQALEDACMFAGAVLLDCCRNVPDFLAELGATRSAGTRALPAGMADVKTATDNLLVAFATSPGTCALDRSSRLPSHSPFTAALLKALEAPRRLNDLGMVLVDEVLRDTARKQRPQAVANYGTEAGTLMLG